MDEAIFTIRVEHIKRGEEVEAPIGRDGEQPRAGRIETKTANTKLTRSKPHQLLGLRETNGEGVEGEGKGRARGNGGQREMGDFG